MHPESFLDSIWILFEFWMPPEAKVYSFRLQAAIRLQAAFQLLSEFHIKVAAINDLREGRGRCLVGERDFKLLRGSAGTPWRIGSGKLRGRSALYPVLSGTWRY